MANVIVPVLTQPLTVCSTDLFTNQCSSQPSDQDSSGADEKDNEDSDENSLSSDMSTESEPDHMQTDVENGRLVKKFVILPKDVEGRDLYAVRNHGTKMALLGGIRSINDIHRKKFEENLLEHIKSTLTQPALASRCKTLDKNHRKSWYKRILLNAEKIDERVSQLNESITETKKRIRDLSTNIITSLVAFAVILFNGLLHDDSDSYTILTVTILTNESAIVLNIMLAIKAFFEARSNRIEQTERQATLLKEYLHQMWEIDRYINSSSRCSRRRKRSRLTEINAPALNAAALNASILPGDN